MLQEETVAAQVLDSSRDEQRCIIVKNMCVSKPPVTTLLVDGWMRDCSFGGNIWIFFQAVMYRILNGRGMECIYEHLLV